MRKFRGALLAFLCAAVLFSATASADTAWQTAYQTKLLSLSAGGNVAVSLCDITGDNVPEIFVFLPSDGTLALYAFGGGAALEKASVSAGKGIKSMAISLRMNDSGEAACSALLRRKNGNDLVAFGRDLSLLYRDGSDSGVYSVSGTKVSKDTFSGKRSAFTTGYPKKGKPIPVALYKNKRAIAAKFPSLCKKALAQGRATKVKLNRTQGKLAAGTSAILKATPVPATAIFDKISWSSSSDAVATVSESGTVRAVSAGTAVITARSTSGGAAKCKITVTAPNPESAELSETALTLAVGNKKQLSVTVTPAGANAKAKWTSSSKKVATVSEKGVVTAKANGTATITAALKGGVVAKCTVTVGLAPTSVSLSQAKASLKAQATLTLKASVKPSGVSQSVTWSTSNRYIATVSSKGVVKGYRAGTATITATTPNGKSASCDVTVAATGETYIVDLSHYNAVADWGDLSKCADLIILRATCGTALDNKFKLYASRCAEYNIPFGVYCFGKATTPQEAALEAQTLYAVSSPYKPLFYVYDIEKPFVTRENVSAFRATLKNLGARKIGYYIAHNLYSQLNINTGEADFIWIPRYGKNTGSVSADPLFPCDLHQYTSMGYIPGIKVRVDLSRLYGKKSLEWFLS
ncbi:MAG: Ig-like domain-containing protein [Christensenellales bacterium]|jgi:uncharacterized protein YjdB